MGTGGPGKATCNCRVVHPLGSERSSKERDVYIAALSRGDACTEQTIETEGDKARSRYRKRKQGGEKRGPKKITSGLKQGLRKECRWCTTFQRFFQAEASTPGVMCSSVNQEASVSSVQKQARDCLQLTERLSGSSRSDDSLANDEVSEVLAVVALEGVRLDHGSENVEDLLLADRLAVDLVQALSPVSSSEKHQVLTGSFSDKGDFGGPLRFKTMSETHAEQETRLRHSRDGHIRWGNQSYAW